MVQFKASLADAQTVFTFFQTHQRKRVICDVCRKVKEEENHVSSCLRDVFRADTSSQTERMCDQHVCPRDRNRSVEKSSWWPSKVSTRHGICVQCMCVSKKNSSKEGKDVWCRRERREQRERGDACYKKQAGNGIRRRCSNSE